MPSRDRTSEFLRATDALRATCTPKVNAVVASSSQKSTFSVQASRIRTALNGTTSKLTRLAKLAQSKSYAFGDPVKEIDELSYVVKEDIKNLQMAVKDMQDQVKARGGETAQERLHSETVVTSLKSNLAETASTFQEVLQTRAQSMQEQEDRRGQFSRAATSGAYSRSSMLIPGLDTPMSEGEDDCDDHSVINMSALVAAQPQNDYLESRAVAVEEIQKTMLELGQVFQDLAFTVEQQKLQLQTVDKNVENTVANVEEASNMWLQFYNSISSDRVLAMKVFGILLTFALFFIVFLK